MTSMVSKKVSRSAAASTRAAMVAAMALGLCVACSGGDGANGGSASTADAASRADAGSTASRKSAFYDKSRSYDLTGDGQPETITLTASGASEDSADVIMAIMSASGDTLYQHRWDTRSYFKYTPRAGMPDSAAKQLVLSRLDRVLSDSAFGVANSSDRDAIRYDIKRTGVRARHALKPGFGLDAGTEDEIEKYRVDESEIDSLAKELKGMPSFTYHAGGELTHTVAWSNTKKRFVTVFSCC